MVIDTVNDVVLGDVGDELVSTAGVAVRPFWWSEECLAALGHSGKQPGSGGSEQGGPGAGQAGEGRQGMTTGGSTSGNVDAGGDAGDGGAGGAGVDDGAADEVALDGQAVGATAAGLGGGWTALIAVLAVIAAAALGAAGYLLWRARGSARGPIAADGPVAREPSTMVGGGPTATVADAAPAYCSQCGARLEPTDKFCSTCGRRL